jgi:hypothetical protein
VQLNKQSTTLCHTCICTCTAPGEPRSSMFGRRETSAASRTRPSNQERVGGGKGGKVGQPGGDPLPRSSPFVAALATLRGSKPGDRPKPWKESLAATGRRGDPDPTSQPSHPPRVTPAHAGPPMHTHHTTPPPLPQPAHFHLHFWAQPTRPRFLFPRIRGTENERGHHLGRRPCSSVCLAVCLSVRPCFAITV